MPANTKRLLLFDILDNIDVQKLGAKGEKSEKLNKNWEKKKLSKAKRNLHQLNLIFDNLLVNNRFFQENPCLSRLRSSHNLLQAVIDAIEDCKEKAGLDRLKQNELANNITSKGTMSKHLHMKCSWRGKYT